MIRLSSRAAVIFGSVTALSAWFALALQLYILVDNTPGNGLTPLQAAGRFFLFFTVLTNLAVAFCLTSILTGPATAAGRFFGRPSALAAVALYIFIVGLVYNIVLRSLWQPVGLQKLADDLLHVIVPLLFLLYWLLFGAKYPLQWKDAVKWLIYPAAYLVYALVRGAAEGFYPYPFIDVKKHGYAQVAFNSAALMVVFVVAGLVFVFIGKKMSKGTDSGSTFGKRTAA